MLLAFLFSLAYTQSPLFTSNQNQYFLHGLARAGFGHLQHDWLVNTQDPTPLFSLLVEWVYRIFQLPAVFYISYVVLMGVYLFSLLLIGDALFNLRRSRLLSLLFLASLIVLHSAVLRLALSRTLGVQWAYLLEAGVAGQRLLGLVFQPSTFGVLLLLSIALFLRQKPLAAILCATVTASFHPTYLLSAAVLTLAYLIVLWIEKTPLMRLAGLGAVALISVAPILIYVYSNFGVAQPDISALRSVCTGHLPHSSPRHTSSLVWRRCSFPTRIDCNRTISGAAQPIIPGDRYLCPGHADSHTHSDCYRKQHSGAYLPLANFNLPGTHLYRPGTRLHAGLD